MIALHPTYVLANRVAIEDEIERLIGVLDTADAPHEDLEPEPDDGCLAGDDGLHPIYREGVAFWGANEGIYPTAPMYGDDQTAGPVNEVEADRSLWRALSSDARKAHGLAPSFWIADEVAQWRHRDLWDNLKTGMAKRAHSLGVTISTQAPDDLHFWSEMLDAPADPARYMQLHAAPKDCALDDREAWAAANPALGVFVNEGEFADSARMAGTSPSFEPAFRNLT